jgi:hypothetical protein
MAKSRRAGMALFQKLLIMVQLHTTQMDNAICFTNNGTKPLIITNTQGSCGCTVPTSPKNQLLQGKRYYWCKMLLTELEFTKTVTVTSNDGQATKILTIKVSY